MKKNQNRKLKALALKILKILKRNRVKLKIQNQTVSLQMNKKTKSLIMNKRRGSVTTFWTKRSVINSSITTKYTIRITSSVIV